MHFQVLLAVSVPKQSGTLNLHVYFRPLFLYFLSFCVSVGCHSKYVGYRVLAQTPITTDFFSQILQLKQIKERKKRKFIQMDCLSSGKSTFV